MNHLRIPNREVPASGSRIRFASHAVGRVVIGTNLALVFFALLAGFAGKLATGKVPFVPAAILVAGALPGAQLGSALSNCTRPAWLRFQAAIVVVLAALRIGADAIK